MNSTPLQKAISELEKLSVEDQQALAARWLEEIKDEQIWASKFAATTDEQWDKLAEKVKQEIANGQVESLDDFLAEMVDE
jgi:hypothetical protein